MLYKGPLVELLGGAELYVELETFPHMMNMMLCQCIWSGIFHSGLTLFKRWKISHLESHYHSVLKR